MNSKKKSEPANKSNEQEKILNELILAKHMNRELQKLIDNSFDGFCVTDGDAITTLVNKSYEKITGRKKEELIGKSMHELVSNGIISNSASLKVLETHQHVTLEQSFKTGKTALVSSNPVFDDKGMLINIITNVRDVTEIYEIKKELAIKEELTNKYLLEIETIKSQLINSPGIIAEDRAMLEVLRIVKKLAILDTTILLLGETGVGKEELAKFVHTNSLRANTHFIKINCGAIPENLIESELFGYVKGAFTGANKDGKMGLFQVADKGTLFLDEIGDLPLDMQVKLLRVLQEQEIIPIGGVSPIKINVRILVATNRNLEEMVAKKLFRADLYYRINIVPIVIPPLRERKNDIMSLSNHFLTDLNKKYNMNKKISKLAMESLLEYNWPGNVRELKNVVERLVIMSSTDVIFKSDLSSNIIEQRQQLDLLDFGEINLKEKLEKMEYEFITQYYRKYQSVRKAAEKLGLDASTFVRKREKYKKKYGYIHISKE